MSGSEEESRGPVIRDRRRIDPVTGQVRATAQPAQPAGGGAGRSAGPGQASRGPGQTRPGKHAASKPGSLRQEAAGAGQPAGQGQAAEGEQETTDRSGGAAGGTDRSEGAAGDLRAKLAERTADLQRLQAEYANYRKRVDRDRTTVRELAVANSLTELLPVLDAIDQAREHGELSGGFKSVADSLQAALTKLGLVSYGQRGDPFDPKIHEALTHSYSPDVTEDTCVEVFQPGYKVGERILRPARVAVAEPATGPDGSANETN